RPKALATALAVIEKLASVRRHFFGGLMTALRAGDCGNFDHNKWRSNLISILGQSMPDVRFTPKSGLWHCTRGCLLWANSGHSDYSMTSWARASSEGGTVRPSALAVFRFMASSYLLGACTGRSAGFSPRNMRSTYPAARRY